MSEDSSEQETSQLSKTDTIGRIQGIRSHIEAIESFGNPYLKLPNIYGLDPVGKSPYIVPNSFVPEEIGGNVAVTDADDESEETLANENLNQMLGSFLPGGYKQRWGNFDLWRGAWHHESKTGHADISPMFEWKESFPLTELLGDVSEVAYTELPFDPEEVRVYVPLSVRVTKENKKDIEYVWIPEKGIVWTGNPPMKTEPLSSDPTTNYLWFKHAFPQAEHEEELTHESSDIVDKISFDAEREFVRCYYASLLTLYEKNSTQTKSGIIRYRCEDDDTTAFVGSKELSQLLTIDLNRDELKNRLETVLDSDGKLRRDLQFAFLRSLIWDRLFFETRELEHKFAVEPLVEHLLGIDYWKRVVDDDPYGVFGLSGSKLVKEVEGLLPKDSDRHLRLLGHEKREVSTVFNTIENNPGPMAELLAKCRNDRLLTEFCEDILVHSTEHALSTWSNNLTGSGTSFELWYDVNFQQDESETAQIAVYDPIQGGAGIAKEVYERIKEDPNPEIDAGLASQGRCHSATADRATVNLLASYPDGSLYDIYQNNRDQFISLVEQSVEEQVDYTKAYSMSDLVAHVDQRVRSLFETRELATFYSYVAGEFSTVEEQVGRIPRVVDLALHLDRHIFTDPQIKATYEQFADDSGRRDIAELGERLAELTVHCIMACPDCLKTEAGLCLHGTGQQETRLNRRLLTAVFES